MSSDLNYTITVSHEEANVVHELLRLLDSAPIDLSEDDYIEVFREIASCGNDVDIEGLVLNYDE